MDEQTQKRLQRANRHIREAIRNALQQNAPDLYAQYREIKYPGGDKAMGTVETKTKATIFLFDTAREVVAPHYVETKEQLDEINAGEDEVDDYLADEEQDEQG